MWKKGFNSFNHIGKRFNSVGHIQEKGSIHWDILKKRFNSSSQVEKRKQFFTSESKKFPLFETSFDTRFNSLSHSARKSLILRVIFEKIRAQFFESYSRNPIQFFESIKKKSILWVMLENNKGSILRVILKRRVHFCEWKEGFNSVSLFRFKKSSILRVILKKEIQFFESCSKSSTLWVIKRGSILWVIKKVQFFESY